MAMLQGDKAIFYHPLDDSTESLKSETWAGTGTFGAARVSNGLIPDGLPGSAARSHVAGGVSFGTESEHLASAAQPLVGMAKLSATKFIVCYSDATTGLARIGTVSGTDITYGAESEFEPASSGTMDPLDVAALSSTTVAIVYQVNSPAARYVKAGTVSGADVTWGAGVSYFASASSRSAIAALTSTKFIVVYRRDSTTSWAARIGTVSGTDVTIGGQKVGTSSGNNDAFDVVALDSTRFVALWHNNLSGGSYWGKVGIVSGTDITFGTPVAFSTSTGSGAAYIAGGALDGTSVLVAYRDGADSQHGTAKVATVSGTDITYGAEAEFLAADATNIGVAALSSTLAAVTYRNEASGDCAAKFATVSGTAITYSDETTFAAGNGGGDVTNKVDAMDSTTFAVAYRDNADSDHGTAKVGSLVADPYDSVIASTKLAFAGWVRNPSA